VNRRRLILRSFTHFKSVHLGIVLGVAIGATVLAGALLVGDSVRLSLRKWALLRIGDVDLAMETGERHFGVDLARRLEGELGGSTVAPLLALDAVASTSGGSHRALGVRVHGIEKTFFELAPEPIELVPLGPGEAYLNERLARRLEAAAGDRVLLRVAAPAPMPKEAVLGGRAAGPETLSVRVAGVIGDEGFGRFGLTASQLPPVNAFVDLAWMQELLGLEGRANLCLVGAGGAVSAPAAQTALLRTFTLSDVGLEARELEDSQEVELRSASILLPPRLRHVLESMDGPSMGVLTHLANELRVGSRSTPYSVVCALGPTSGAETDGPWDAILPEGMTEPGVVINRWLADDLQAEVGDELSMRYWRADGSGELVEEEVQRRIGAIVPVEGLAADPTLMPPFPGMAEDGTCADWEIDLPIDYEKIRDEDEEWWEAHGGTPKAFVSLDAGQQMWGSQRFGWMTAVRVARERSEAFRKELRAALDPGELGLVFRDVRTPALAASSPATDFGGLFLGLSFFLLLSAFLLVGLLLSLGVLQRSHEVGTLLAVGFRPRTVRRLLLGEALVLAAVGSILGAALAAGYGHGVILALDTIWKGAVAGATLESHTRPVVLATGAAATVVIALFAAWLTLRKQLDRPAVELLAARAGVESESRQARKRKRRVSTVVALVAFHGWMPAQTWCVGASGPTKPAASFLAGVLALLATIAICRALLAGRAKPRALGFTTLAGLAWSNAQRRPARSLAVIVLIATGAFLVLIVGSFRKVLPDDPAARASGTGGFALIGRSSLGLVREYASGPDEFTFTNDPPDGVSVVPMRWKEGDETSCLNLNRPQRPSLLGVDPVELASREAFTFDAVLEESAASPWMLLQDLDPSPVVVPAIGDSAAVMWSLHRALGETVPMVDERGLEFEVQIVATLAGSILQGDLLIDDGHFRQRFPTESGYRAFLVDAPEEEAEALATEWMRRLSDEGLELESTSTRLAELAEVQNTYLVVFQILGGLGLLLGTVGLGVVVLRNVGERRGELAVLAAVGFPAGRVRRALLFEHGALLLAGTACGVLGALAAVLPLLGAEGGTSPLLALLAVPAAMAICGALCVSLASRLAWRGPVVERLARGG